MYNQYTTSSSICENTSTMEHFPLSAHSPRSMYLLYGAFRFGYTHTHFRSLTYYQIRLHDRNYCMLRYMLSQRFHGNRVPPSVICGWWWITTIHYMCGEKEILLMSIIMSPPWQNFLLCLHIRLFRKAHQLSTGVSLVKNCQFLNRCQFPTK